jgi:hypothetical protein
MLKSQKIKVKNYVSDPNFQISNRLLEWLLISYIKATCWLLNITSSHICNTGFLSSIIAYKCPILVRTIPCGCPFRDHIDYKKTFP